MLITLDATPLLGTRTGIGRYTAHLVAQLPGALARRGAEGAVRVTTWTARGGRLTDLPAGVRQVGPRVPARVLRALWSRGDRPRVESLVGRTDVFHGTNFVSPPTRAAREVVTVHDLTYALHASTVSADSLRYAELVPRALRRGAHVLVPSDAVADAVREHYSLGADRVSTTPLGVDPVWFEVAPPSATWLDDRALPHDYLVFVGSLDPRKNLRVLLEAHARLRADDTDAPDLVLAGPAGRDTSLAGRPGVHLTGWLPDADLRTLVAGARALVLPSLDEGFGLPVVEALAAGRPVVTSRAPALLEVGGRHARTAPAEDADALADALGAVLRDADDDASRRERRAWAERFSWSRCADLTVDAYLAA
ncbi:glycosyltransferase [Cellulomonas sp. NS3]|uniref:glycosyltransferase n=1 Tax=Cellulomonas sp. NS3 TaxID=2973977 RepID=UPI00216269CA|nr:glycosyltransferase family 1 protein [Cellulomonas sp. NS3]